MGREAPVRACFGGEPRSYNFEIKSVDGTSNPYLALSGILAAGMMGIEKSTPLSMKRCSGRSMSCQPNNRRTKQAESRKEERNGNR